MRDGFLGDVLHHAQANGVVQFVHVQRVVGRLARHAAFEHRDGQRPVRPVISLAIARPVQPPPMMATSTGLRFVS